MKSALTAAEVAKVELPLAQNSKVVIIFHVTLYVAPRAARAIMNIFGPIDPGEWHNRTWRDVLEVMVDTGDHLSVGPDAAPLFPLDTPTSAISAQLPFPLEHLPMFICIVSGNLQADISDLPYFGRPHRKWRCRPSQSQPATTALAQNRASIARTAATALDGTICHGPTAARAAILDETTWDGPSATRAAITAFTVDRHSAMLHHVAQRSSYHPATLAW